MFDPQAKRTTDQQPTQGKYKSQLIQIKKITHSIDVVLITNFKTRAGGSGNQQPVQTPLCHSSLFSIIFHFSFVFNRSEKLSLCGVWDPSQLDDKAQRLSPFWLPQPFFIALLISFFDQNILFFILIFLKYFLNFLFNFLFSQLQVCFSFASFFFCLFL